MRKLLVVSIGIAGLTLSLIAQAQAPAEEQAPERRGNPGLFGEFTPRVSEEIGNGPVPRLHDGKPDLSGPWVGGGSNNNMEADAGMEPGEMDALLLPWAKALRDARSEDDEPYLYCTPMGVPRVNPYPWRFVQAYMAAGPTHIFVIHENGDAGGHRQIFMDGRPHPVDPLPTWWGHSIGEWDGDTLVIDTVGYNDKFWFDSRGTPHTEQLHTIERWTRINYGSMTNVFTLDDPGAFSRPFDMTFTARALPPGDEMMEFICAENNQYGPAGAIPNIYLENGYGLEVPVPNQP